MDSATIERLIARISWEYVPATVRNIDGQLISLFMRSPTQSEQSKAAHLYNVELSRAITVGLPSEKNVLETLISIGQWSEQQESEINGLHEDIHTLRKGILDFVFNRTKLEQTRSLLRRAENVLISKLNTRHNLLQGSAEAHAEICRQQYLIGRITETEDHVRLWKTEDDFSKCEDQELINELCTIFFQKSRIPVVIIRELARSQQWRMYWETAKQTNDLFDGPVIRWSLNQRELAYWSTIYDSVYNAFERPSKDIIEDDDLLDSWFIRQGEKIEGKTSGGIKSNINKSGRNEEFVMADREGAKRVYNMNDPISRAKIKARQKLLKEQGKIREQDMPDSQNEMKMQLSDMQSKKVRSINSR